MSYILGNALINRELIEYDHKLSTPEIVFRIGKRPEVTEVKVIYRSPKITEKNIRKYHFMVSIGPVIVSPQLHEVLYSIASDEIDFYPASVVCKDTTISDYWAIRPKTLAPCFDMEKSEYEPSAFNPEAYNFSYIELQKEVPYNLHIVRSEEMPRYIVVDESIKTACFDTKLTGLLFCSKLDASFQNRECCVSVP